MQAGGSGANTVVAIGGQHDPASASFVGPVAEETAQNYSVDVAFFSTKGFIVGEGTFESAKRPGRAPAWQDQGLHRKGSEEPIAMSMRPSMENRWINRLIGDEQYPDDAQYHKTSYGTGSQLSKWPTWFPDLSKRGEPRRVAGPTIPKYYTKDSPLVPAGLLGPITVWTVTQTQGEKR